MTQSIIDADETMSSMPPTAPVVHAEATETVATVDEKTEKRKPKLAFPNWEQANKELGKDIEDDDEDEEDEDYECDEEEEDEDEDEEEEDDGDEGIEQDKNKTGNNPAEAAEAADAASEKTEVKPPRKRARQG